MGDLVEFPTFDQRTWRKLEDGLTKNLRGSGKSEEATGWIISETKRRILEVIPSMEATPPAVPPGASPELEAALVDAHAHFCRMLYGLIGQLVLALTELQASRT